MWRCAVWALVVTVSCGQERAHLAGSPSGPRPRLGRTPNVGAASLLARPDRPTRSRGRVVVIGVDGMDHALTRELMAAGSLPHLAALARDGDFRPLEPTNPAQSPTSWASITTGLNPGRTGIFGFLRRSVRDGKVVPEMALAEGVQKEILTPAIRWAGVFGAFLIGLLPVILFGWWGRRRLGLFIGIVLAGILLAVLRWLYGQIPESLTVPRNLRSGEALWSSLDREGVPVVSLFAPCSFPAPELQHGHLLCGLGVPDLQATPGSVTVFRDAPVQGGVRFTQMGGREAQLRRRPGTTEFTGAHLAGPRHPVSGERLSIPLRISSEDGKLRVQYPDVDARLSVGEFSEFLPVKFTWGDVLPPLRGLVRFRPLAGEPAPALYVEPVQFDPRHQNRFAPVTSPLSFGAELTEHGLFETLGWATATNPYQDELIDDATLLADVRGLVAQRQGLVMQQLRKDGWRLHFSVLSTPDRVQHMFWRDRDPTHPAHDAEGAKRRGDVILESYQAIDALVGRIRTQVLGADDTLVVLSDHGFAPFRHAVNVNSWLAREGYLVGKPVGERSLQSGLGKPVPDQIDWAKTKAYSLGLGRIWLNVKGREPEGCVAPKDARGLADEIAEKLLSLRHEERQVVHSVKRSDQLYVGKRTGESADLIVGFARGYRISWNSCLLGYDEEVVFPNRSRWSGDHCSVDPSLVPGVLFASRKLADRPATAVDVLPTLRALLGLAPDSGLDGRALVETGK